MIAMGFLLVLASAQPRTVVTSVAPHPPTLADQAARLRAMGLSLRAVEMIQAYLQQQSKLPACSELQARKLLNDLLGAAVAQPFDVTRFEQAARASDARNERCKAAERDASLRLLRSLPRADQPIYAKSMISL